MSAHIGYYHDGYANLAWAILQDGIRSNDRYFLESDWADVLREICRLDDILHPKHVPLGVVIDRRKQSAKRAKTYRDKKRSEKDGD